MNSFFTVTPSGGNSTSTVNFGAGEIVTNHTTVSLSSGNIRVYNAFGSAQVDVDIEAYLYPPS